MQWFQSLGIKIKSQNKSIVYTGDIGSSHNINNLKKIINDVDLLLIEASNIEPSKNHFTINQIIQIAEDCNVKKIIATHVRDKNQVILKKKIKNYKNIILAEDLIKIKI